MFKWITLSLLLWFSHSVNAVTKLPPQTLITKVALGSCFAPQLDQSILDTINQNQPQLFLFLGDNVYQSEENFDLQQPNLAEAYQLLRQSKGFNQLRQHTEILPIWDDHDFGMNDAGATFAPKFRSQQLFNQMWQIDKHDDRYKRDGVYFAKTYGPKGQQVQFIMLDTRFFRSDVPADPNDKTVTMLGEQQWQWLEQQLKQPADIRFVATSVQVLVDKSDSEGWYHFANERRRLIALLKQHQTVVILSGDRHFANFYQHQGLIEMTSSSLNFPIFGNALSRLSQKDEAYELAKKVFEPNFSLIEFDWDKRQLTLQIRSQNNQIKRVKTINF